MRTIATQCQDWSPTGDEFYQEDPHVLQSGQQGIANGGGEQAPGKDLNCLERGGRMAV